MYTYKKCVCLISIVLLLCIVGNASAADVQWNNAGGDRLWRNADNWDLDYVPASGDKAAIRDASVSGPIIDGSTTAQANQVVVGDWGSTSDSLDMTGGSLTTGAWFILGYGSNNDGTFNMSAGTVNVGSNLYVGFGGTGTLEMTGGSITVADTFGIAQSGGEGEVELDGGTISSGSFSMTSGAQMEITEGTLIVNGDVTSTINGYISSGWITAYNGTGTVNVDYDVTNPGKTTVTGTREPADVEWTNGSGDRLWRNSANWDLGYVPTSIDKAGIRNASVSGPIIDGSTTAQANKVVCGDWGSTSDTLDMTGGTLTTNEWLILGYDSNNSGTFTMSAGTVNVGTDLYVGFSGTGTLDITGGTITVTGIFGVAQTGGTGYVYLDGGTITSNMLHMATGTAMDITAGTLIVNGDITSAINVYISNGWISAYNGTGTVNADYDVTNPGKTTVTGDPTPPPIPGQVTNRSPSEGATGVSTVADLTWTAGFAATSHDVYFGTSYSDVNDGNTSSVAFKGNQTAASYDVAILSYDTTYYWRIDEVNSPNTTKGDTWNFTTVATGTEGVLNGDFEDGSGEFPDYWTTSAWKPADANFTWEPDTGMGGSKCVSIFIDPPLVNDARWETTVENLELGKWYNIRGYIKGENITGGAAGANLSIMGTSTYFGSKLGTFDWQEAIFSYQPVLSNSIVIGARMGHWGSTVSGKAWFDNITVDDPYEYTCGQHINLILEETDINVIELSKFQEWNDNLDMAYESYAELVGGVPYGGAKIEIVSVRQYPGGWAVAGNPIKWQQKYVSQTLQRIGDNNDWSFGILHEISHDFDIDSNWNFRAETMANIKMFYVAEDLNTLIYQEGTYYEGNDLKYFYEGKYNQSDFNEPHHRYLNPVWGGVLYRFALISEELEWDTFKDTYRSYGTDPPSPPPSTQVEKFDLFLDRLLFYAGREGDDPNTLMPQIELDWIRNYL
jgi:hypothetical protein